MTVSPSPGRQIGLTLVEVVAFLVVMGVGAAALLPMIKNVLPRSASASQITRATQMAQARMELIMGQRSSSGFSGLNDPCQAAAPPACTVDSGYSLTVIGVPTVASWPTITDTSRFRLVTVRVSGPDGNLLSILNTVSGNY
jgi:Tfp pilus assembly protein PilV